MTHADYSTLRRGYGTDEDREAALDAADYCHECGTLVCDEDERVLTRDGELCCTTCGDALEPCFACGVPLLDAEAFAGCIAEGFVLDTREPEGYAGGHLAGSHSVWLGGLPVFGGWLADERSPVHLVSDRDEDVETAALHLARIGIDNVRGALAGGDGPEAIHVPLAFEHARVRLRLPFQPAPHPRFGTIRYFDWVARRE